MSLINIVNLWKAALNKRVLGKTDLDLTRIGFGAWAIGGGGWEYGWGSQDDRQSIAAIHRAVDLGINWIDTAAAYGFGHSETIVGEALKGLTNRPYVFTKGGLVADGNRNVVQSLKRESLRREIDASLRRLGIDAIDLYQIHWPTEDIEEGWRALSDAQTAGKVRWIGVSNFSIPEMERIEQIAPIDSLQPPFSLLDRDAESELLPYCLEHEIGAIVYSPMASGLLSGAMTRERVRNLPADDWRRTKSPWFQEPQLTANLKLADLLNRIGLQYDRSAGEVAIAWTLRNPAVTGAIVGIRSPHQLDGVIGGDDFELTDHDIAEIERHFAERGEHAA
jgi:aryl-alcohol dehydrogenase-like predicted oxidoreductase